MAVAMVGRKQRVVGLSAAVQSSERRERLSKIESSRARLCSERISQDCLVGSCTGGDFLWMRGPRRSASPIEYATPRSGVILPVIGQIVPAGMGVKASAGGCDLGRADRWTQVTDWWTRPSWAEFVAVEPARVPLIDRVVAGVAASTLLVLRILSKRR